MSWILLASTWQPVSMRITRDPHVRSHSPALPKALTPKDWRRARQELNVPLLLLSSGCHLGRFCLWLSQLGESSRCVSERRRPVPSPRRQRTVLLHECGRPWIAGRGPQTFREGLVITSTGLFFISCALSWLLRGTSQREWPIPLVTEDPGATECSAEFSSSRQLTFPICQLHPQPAWSPAAWRGMSSNPQRVSPEPPMDRCWELLRFRHIR